MAERESRDNQQVVATSAIGRRSDSDALAELQLAVQRKRQPRVVQICAVSTAMTALVALVCEYGGLLWTFRSGVVFYVLPPFYVAILFVLAREDSRSWLFFDPPVAIAFGVILVAFGTVLASFVNDRALEIRLLAVMPATEDALTRMKDLLSDNTPTKYLMYVHWFGGIALITKGLVLHLKGLEGVLASTIIVVTALARKGPESNGPDGDGVENEDGGADEQADG